MNASTHGMTTFGAFGEMPRGEMGAAAAPSDMPRGDMNAVQAPGPQDMPSGSMLSGESSGMPAGGMLSGAEGGAGFNMNAPAPQQPCGCR